MMIIDVTWNPRDPGRVAVSTTIGTVVVFGCDFSSTATAMQSTPPPSVTSSYSPSAQSTLGRHLGTSPSAAVAITPGTSNAYGTSFGSVATLQSASYASLPMPQLFGALPPVTSITRKQEWDSGDVISRSAVHRLGWSCIDNFLLGTACHDGHVRLFDTRASKKCIDFSLKSIDIVRDVQFDPFAPHNLVSSIAENGTFCLWDSRFPDNPVVKFLAHGSGGGLSLSYHPTLQGYVATGGRDKQCKTWNLNLLVGEESGNVSGTSHTGAGGTANPGMSMTKPIHTLRTSTSVGRIRWRGLAEHPDELATSGPDRTEINVWSLRSPLIASCVLRGHAEACSDFDWLDTPFISPTNTPSNTVDRYDNPSTPARGVRKIKRNGCLMLFLNSSY
jgi:WD40 repeat protein